MAFLTIKKIKGKRYLYYQINRREGKKVISKCQCLGRFDFDNGKYSLSLNKSNTNKHDLKKPIMAEKAHDTPVSAKPITPEQKQIISKKDHHKKEDKSSLKKVINTTVNDVDKTQSIQKQHDFARHHSIGINTKKYGIFEKSFDKSFCKQMKQLEKLGIDSSKLPKIRVGYGKEITNKECSYIAKGVFKCGYVMTIPKYLKGGQTKIKNEYNKIVAKAGLELIKNQQPSVYKKLASEFEKSHQETQKALNSYIQNTNAKNKQVMGIAQKHFGNISFFEKMRVAPKYLGVADFGNCKTWEDEYSGIMSKIQTQGFDRFHKDAEKIYYSSRNTQKAKTTYYEELRSSKVKSVFNIVEIGRTKRELNRLDSAIKAQHEMIKKLDTINDVFKFKI